jgi:membrane-bound lytic murein transglycosylase D
MINSARKTIILAIFLVSGTVLSVIIGVRTPASHTRAVHLAISHDTIHGQGTFPLPDSVSFAGEKVPLDNFDTRESLEREIVITAYRHSSTLLILKRMGRYFPAIEKILRQNGIPDDFRYLAVAESDLTNTISPAGAVGFWQIMEDSGKEGGLEINKIVDERYDFEKATQFACNYFHKSYERYGSWTLAAASYDNGRNGIDEQVAVQRKNNYYDLLLNEETARYIFRALAYKIILNNPEQYRFSINRNEAYSPFSYREVKTDTSITDLAGFAAGYGTNYKLLKLLNPWLRKPYLTPAKGKMYTIKIPAAGMRKTDFREN